VVKFFLAHSSSSASRSGFHCFFIKVLNGE
jgi:hypothetical protein